MAGNLRGEHGTGRVHGGVGMDLGTAGTYGGGDRGQPRHRAGGGGGAGSGRGGGGDRRARARAAGAGGDAIGRSLAPPQGHGGAGGHHRRCLGTGTDAARRGGAGRRRHSGQLRGPGGVAGTQPGAGRAHGRPVRAGAGREGAGLPALRAGGSPVHAASRLGAHHQRRRTGGAALRLNHRQHPQCGRGRAHQESGSRAGAARHQRDLRPPRLHPAPSSPRSWSPGAPRQRTGRPLP